MESLFATLVSELRTLRKGRGVFVGQIAERVGPALPDVCGITDNDAPSVIRRKVAEQVTAWASDLPEDLRIALMAAFGIDLEARLPFYQDRVRWAAERMHRDDRTARRRIDEGIDRVVELAASSSGGLWAPPPDSWWAAWYTEELRIAVALDLPEPEALEIRRIVANRDDLAEIDLAVTLSAGPERSKPVAPEDLAVDVFYGGTSSAKTWSRPTGSD